MPRPQVKPTPNLPPEIHLDALPRSSEEQGRGVDRGPDLSTNSHQTASGSDTNESAATMGHQLFEAGRTRLSSLLRMCASDHSGERAAAAASKLVREAGATWCELLAPPAVRLDPSDDLATNWRATRLCPWPGIEDGSTS
jgi:hypothetical protein